MTERGGGVYKRMDARPYTRRANRKPSLNYIKGVPRPKIHLFEMGDSQGRFDTEISLVADETAQIKHNALEAARVAAVKNIANVGPKSFFIKMRIYPHHVLRENPLATGAGADRFQEGMSRAFGKPIGMAARVKRDQKILSISINNNNLVVAKDALRRAKMKFPLRCRVQIDDLTKKPAPKAPTPKGTPGLSSKKL
ncbi:MAG: 50S ribosomal protein L16 [archaeon]